MKKFFVVAGLIALSIALVFVSQATYQDKQIEYLRVHIRANSNATIDQTVKYKVKDQVVNFLTPLFLDCTTKAQAESILNNNLYNIECIANEVLKNNNCSYECKAKLNNEYFPARAYEQVVLESGFYDALILELGEAAGNNWWCVVYPPLCFVENQQNVVYKSKFLEIINKLF